VSTAIGHVKFDMAEWPAQRYPDEAEDTHQFDKLKVPD